MKISYSKIFIKQYNKKDFKIKEKFIEKQILFSVNLFYPVLNNHSLGGIWKGCRSINITGDFRAVYEELADDHFEFIAIGTHSELYS